MDNFEEDGEIEMVREEKGERRKSKGMVKKKGSNGVVKRQM